MDSEVHQVTPDGVTVSDLDSHDLGLGGAFEAFKAEQAAKDAPAPVVEEKKVIGDEPAAEVKPAEEIKPAATATEVKPAEEPKAAEEVKPATVEEEDEFSPLKLPKHARSDTAKQFEESKRIGRGFREQAKKAEAELADLRRKFEEASKNQGQPDKNTLEELEAHRKFRRLYDVRNSPAFKEKFTKNIEGEEARIFTQMKRAGFTDDAVEKVKKLGVTGVDWDSALASVGSLEKNGIFSSVQKIMDIREAQEAEEAKAAEDRAEYEKYVASLPDNETVRTKVSIDGAMGLLNEAKTFELIDTAKALPEGVLSKEHAAALNEGSKAAKGFLEAYSKDSTAPQTVAQLLAIGAAAQRYLHTNKYLVAERATHVSRISELEKQLAEANDKFSKVKQAGAAPGIPAGGSGSPRPPVVPGADDFSSGSIRERFKSFTSNPDGVY